MIKLNSSVEQASVFIHRSKFPTYSIIFLPIILTTLILLQIKTFSPSLLFSLSAPPPASRFSDHGPFLSMLRRSITFLPLKDLRLSDHPMEGNTWFMSSLPDSPNTDGEPSYIRFPSETTNNRLLCLSAVNPHDGARNSYALAFPEALPENSTLFPGLTFVSDTFYDYTNLWHGHTAIVPFVRWHVMNGCTVPLRWALFHWGEVRKEMGGWVGTLAEAVTGGDVSVVTEYAGRTACFAEAVVMRRNDWGMSRETKEEVYDFMRCRARAFCGLARRKKGRSTDIRMTLLFRMGSRSFKNETAVAGVFERECRKVEGCRVRLARPGNLSFCDQVKLMSETDILVSPHGAQMTNMIFLDKNSSVMEFFPKGWLELAGAGQYVFQWLAVWTGMKHQGQWRDRNGESCPFEDKSRCFTFFKDGRIGHDEAFFSKWAAQVLQEARLRQSPNSSERSDSGRRYADFNSCSSCS